MNRASLDKQPVDVASMFDQVAARYDITNDILSIGQTRRWRKAVYAALSPRRGSYVLDIAAGTGTSSVPFERAGVHVVSADFSLGMLKQGRKQHPGLTFVAADAMRLPFADATFDAVTMSFGLRNVVDPEAALREFARVTKPRGRVVIAEFSTPTNPAFRGLYHNGALAVLPSVARRTSSNPESYVYLAESIRAWPDQHELAAIMGRAGWSDPHWRNLSGGIVAVHRATRVS